MTPFPIEFSPSFAAHSAALTLIVHDAEGRNQQTGPFFNELDHEFVHTDLQQRLRDKSTTCGRRTARAFRNTSPGFRRMNLQIKGMNEIDKIAYFQRRLRQVTSEEV